MPFVAYRPTVLRSNLLKILTFMLNRVGQITGLSHKNTWLTYFHFSTLSYIINPVAALTLLSLKILTMWIQGRACIFSRLNLVTACTTWYTWTWQHGSYHSAYIIWSSFDIINNLIRRDHGFGNSNEAGVLEILEALRLVADTHLDRVIVESDSFNDVSWVSSFGVGPWKLILSSAKFRCCLLLFKWSLGICFNPEIRWQTRWQS